jgi:hypothetical protein
LIEEDLENITKEWSTNLLVAADPAEMFDMDRTEVMPDTPGPRKTKKDYKFQDVHSTSTKTTSISPMQGGDGEELGGTKVEKKEGDVTPPREEEDPSKKRNITPPNPSSQNKTKVTQTMFKTTLTLDDFDFLIVALSDDSLEIAEKQEASRRRYSVESRVNFKKCNKHSSPAEQFLLCP